MKKLLAKIRKILHDRRTRRFLTRFVSGVAALIVFVTTYALVLPAITMEKEANCGIEAHQHDDSCYTEELICDIPESDGHHHDESCYSTTSALVCETEEHEHSVENGCYDDERNLICEVMEHRHNEECYEEVRELTCRIPESEGHHHTEDCYEKVLTCGKEVHVHSTACYENDPVSESAVAASTSSAAASTTSAGSVSSAGMTLNFEGDIEKIIDADEPVDGDFVDNLGADETNRSSETNDTSEIASSSETNTEAASDTEVTYGRENAGTGRTETSNTALTNVDNSTTALTSSADTDQYIPQLDAVDFNTVLNNHTGIYYHHAADEETVEDSFAIPAEDWNRIPNNNDRINDDLEDVELGKNDILRVYLSYTIPAGSLNASNPVARYRLPSNLHLTDPQVKAINENVNGLAGQYVDMSTLEITDPDKYNAYLGVEAVEGTRRPDEAVEDYLAEQARKAGKDADDAAEYISAVVRVENVYDADGLYGEKDAYLGQDLIFTFAPYSIEKNQHEYDSTGKPTKAGEEIKGWFTFDLNMGQVDFREEENVQSAAEEPDTDDRSGSSEDDLIEDPHTENDYAEKNRTDENYDKDEKTEDVDGVDDYTKDGNLAEKEQSENEYSPEKNAADHEDSAEGKSGEETESSRNNVATIEHAERNAEIVFVEEGWDEKGNKIDRISTFLTFVEKTPVEPHDNDNEENASGTVIADEPGIITEDTAEPSNNGGTGTKAEELKADTTDSTTDEKAETETRKTDVLIMPAMSFSDSIRVSTGKPSGIDENAGGTLANAAESLPEKAEVSVRVEADEGTFPVGTIMVLKVVEKDSIDALADTLAETVENHAAASGDEAEGSDSSEKQNGNIEQNEPRNKANLKTYGFQAVDITFIDADGNEIEPEKPVRVALTSAIVGQVKEEAKTTSIADPVVVHVEDDGKTEQMELLDPKEIEPARGRSEKELMEEDEKNRSAASADPTDAEKDETGMTEAEDDSSEGSESADEAKTVVSGGDTETGNEGSGSPDLSNAAEENGAENKEAEKDRSTNSTMSEDAEAADTAGAGATVGFQTGSFSVYAIVYTVDFHYDVNGRIYDYSIKGGDIAGLKELLPVLNVITDDESTAVDEVQTFLNDIESVRFSDENLIKIEKITADITAGELKEKIRNETGAEPEYSGELTEEQIAGMNAKEFKAPDWALVSMKAFDTEESLVVSMKSGEVWTVVVTDAQDPLGIDDRTVAFVFKTSNTTGVSAQSSINNNNLSGRAVSYTQAGNVEYCDENASVWLFEYDIDKDAYYISNGYHTDGSTRYLRMYSNTGNAAIGLDTNKTSATPVKIEKNADGTYRLYVENGGTRHYLTYNSNSSSFYSRRTNNPDGNSNIHFCLPEENGSSASHKATLISAVDTQPGQKLIIYQRIWGTDANGTQVAYYYAINGDGNLIPVKSSSDSIYWKGDQTIEWELTDVGSGYYTLSGKNSRGQTVYLVPKSDGIVFTGNEAAFEGNEKHLNISLPGRDIYETYTSKIASWDYNAFVTYGMSATASGITPTEYLNSQEFYFATRDPIVQGELTEVDTVNSKDLGITIEMYDFSGPAGNQNRLAFMTAVLPDDEWMPYELHQGLTQRVLGSDGYPVSSQGSHRSLKDIFETNTYGTSSVKKEANHLFIQSVYNETGFFKYSCFENYAYLNSNGNFSVYEQIGTPYNKDNGPRSRWSKTNRFGQTYIFPENQTSYNNNQQDYEGNHTYYQRGNFMPYNRLVTTNGKRTNEYDSDLVLLDANDPRRGEDLYVIENGNGYADYFFGMIMKAKFSQNPEGISDYGDPMVYQFNGDDDLWVYVDNVLLLDMGGVHDAFRGKIDFNTGNIYVNGNIYDISDGSKKTNPTTTIKEQFWKARKFPDGSDWTNYNDSRVNNFFTGNTFKDFTTHDFRMFYMERGAGASNLEVGFNLPVMVESEFRVKKEMKETQSGEGVQSDYGDAPFYYVAYVWDGNTSRYVPCTRAYLASKELGMPVYKGEGDIDHPVYVDWLGDDPDHPENNDLDQKIFLVRHGQTASFPALDDSVRWYAVEVSPPDNTNMLSKFDVQNSDQDNTPNDTPQQTDQYNTNYKVGAKAREETIKHRNTVIYRNKPIDTLVNDLQIKKKTTGEPYDARDSFEFRVLLEKQDDTLDVYRFGEYYQFDKDGRFVFFEQGRRYTAEIQKLQNGRYYYHNFKDDDGNPVSYHGNSAETRESQWITEHTSMNGSLNNIREGDMIVIKGLVVGTDFYVFERTNYDNISDDDTLIDGKYVFEGTDVIDAYTRNPQSNIPDNDFVFNTLYGQPDQDALNALLAEYDTTDYEKEKAASGAITDNLNALVLVYNKPYWTNTVTVEKEWQDVEGNPLEGHPDNITFDVYQFHHVHNWSDWEVVTAASASAEGLERRLCQCSDCSAEETRIIEAGGHNFVKARTVAPACDTEGYDLYVCSKNPEHVDRRNIVEALGHQWNDRANAAVVVPATCTEEGLRKYTCQREGCNREILETIAALRHDWGDWSYTEEPTETKDGEIQRICRRCNKVDTQGIKYNQQFPTDPVIEQPELPDYPVVYLPDSLRTMHKPDPLDSTKGSLVELYKYSEDLITLDGSQSQRIEGENDEIVYWTKDYKYPKCDNDENEFTYYIRETFPSTGYKTTYTYFTGVYNTATEQIDYTRTTDSGMKNYGKTHITNRRVIDLDLYKTTSIGEPLTGAAFRLEYKTAGSSAYTTVPAQAPGDNVTGVTFAPLVPTESITFDATKNTFTIPSGGIKIDRLKHGMYKLVEVVAPDGYIILDNSIFISVDDSNTDQDAVLSLTDAEGNAILQTRESAVTLVDDNLSVKNEPGVELPSTGGPGTRLIYLIGWLLSLAAVAGLAITRAKGRMVHADDF